MNNTCPKFDFFISVSNLSIVSPWVGEMGGGSEDYAKIVSLNQAGET